MFLTETSSISLDSDQDVMNTSLEPGQDPMTEESSEVIAALFGPTSPPPEKQGNKSTTTLIKISQQKVLPSSLPLQEIQKKEIKTGKTRSSTYKITRLKGESLPCHKRPISYQPHQSKKRGDDPVTVPLKTTFSGKTWIGEKETAK